MKWSAFPPLVLDFDHSVKKLTDDEIRLELGHWQQTLRYGCSWPDLRRFELCHPLPPDMGCLFTGSGDYHHLSLMPLKKLAEAEGPPLTVVVCDNHPDNMRYPFGVHCGSWVRWAAAMKGISHIHVLGITSRDVGWAGAWENNWRPLFSGRLTYWCVGRKPSWLKLAGRGQSGRSFETADELLESFTRENSQLRRVYLSIDKDVFGPETVTTTWDQGLWEKRHLAGLIAHLAGGLAGVDVTGEVSAFNYQGIFKKTLTWLDGLEQPDQSKLEAWQTEQQKLNLEILAMLKKAGH